MAEGIRDDARLFGFQAEQARATQLVARAHRLALRCTLRPDARGVGLERLDQGAHVVAGLGDALLGLSQTAGIAPVAARAGVVGASSAATGAACAIAAAGSTAVRGLVGA